MVIKYDKNPSLTVDEKLDSLVENVQLALGEYRSSNNEGASIGDISTIMSALQQISSNVTYLLDTISSLDTRVSDVEDAVATIPTVLDFYPIGSIYETSDSTFDPNVTWGGTWVLDPQSTYRWNRIA